MPETTGNHFSRWYYRRCIEAFMSSCQLGLFVDQQQNHVANTIAGNSLAANALELCVAIDERDLVADLDFNFIGGSRDLSESVLRA
ncbi:MAG: hypothetical protein HKN47_10090 [Pirellulaceae bacterium]|nr:hypothetical protein [Pirellulaceae bacterium]